ncbi:MAG: NAD(P)H-hydrate epimerase, partial [Planctomycetota bacterium]|nr:NAD(P)H-hydrate epimerase [Planctomycetota bacterium]
RHLDNAGHAVEVHLAFDAARLTEGADNTVNFRILEKSGVRIVAPLAPHPPPPILGSTTPHTVVDALLGSGLSRPLGSPTIDWVRATRAGRASVVALDIPTGLDAASGAILGDAVRARQTITFAAPKLGFQRGSGPEVVGEVHVVDIGMPRAVRETADPGAPGDGPSR